MGVRDFSRDEYSDPPRERSRPASKRLMREFRSALEADLATIESNLDELRELDPSDVVVDQDNRETTADRAIRRLEAKRRSIRVSLGLETVQSPLGMMIAKLRQKHKRP